VAVRIDANGEFLSGTTAAPTTSDWSLTFNFRINVDRDALGYVLLVANAAGTTYDALYLAADGTSLRTDRTGNTGAVQGLTAGTWYKVGVKKSGTSLYTRINKSLAATHTVAGTFTPGQFVIGSVSGLYPNADYAFLKFWSAALSDAALDDEVDYADPDSANIASLRSWFEFKSGALTADSSGNGRNLTSAGSPAFASDPAGVGYRTAGERTASVTGTLPLAGSASATVAVQASATGALPLSGSATATVAITASASGTLLLSGSAAATVAVAATASGTLPLSGSAAAAVTSNAVTATASGVLPLSGAATATVAVALSAAGALPLSGAVTTSVAVNATAAGVLPLGGTASAKTAVTATAAGVLHLSGSAASTVAITASASGALPLTGAGAVRVAITAQANGGLPLSGSASAQIAIAASASGVLSLSGSALATVTIIAQASGVLPLTVRLLLPLLRASQRRVRLLLPLRFPRKPAACYPSPARLTPWSGMRPPLSRLPAYCLCPARQSQR
jgi:hypothetical protein